MEGRYGPFVKSGKINASVPKDINLDDVNLKSLLSLIQNQKNKKRNNGFGKPKHAASLVITRQKKKICMF